MESEKMNIAVYLLLIAISVSACCSEIQLPSSIIAEPLYKAELPQNIDEINDVLNSNLLDLFIDEKLYLYPNFLSGAIKSSINVVWVRMELFAFDKESENKFEAECKSPGFQDPQKFTYAGYPGNQYCISYMTQERSDPEGLCAPMNEYTSKAIFQKGRILIVLEEWAHDKSNEQLNQIIEVFADRFSEK